ncbi:DNA topoisomerase IB [Pendulispora rubella]|uniref:DNA topoisomerase n=1 Tax=Pendulispora rubella TaxID=2741070 RepID=A0ABZ2LC95_9BACT
MSNTPSRVSGVVLEALDAAKAAGLRYVSDSSPGIRRVRCGKGARYVAPDGSAVRDPEMLRRIRGLVIPPAWSKVWIARIANAHIQATGRDAKGRKQYIYHPRWREVRDESKYDKLVAFARALPKIQKTVDMHLAQRGLHREKVLATVVRLLEITRIRVGSEEYARTNGSFGLTTLRGRHVDIDGGRLSFHFRGKSGKEHVIDVEDRRLARIVAQCSELPGQELFQYVDEAGERHTIESADINEYIRSIAGNGFTAKDFRTWAGTVLAARALGELAATVTTKPTKKAITEVVKVVATHLGNTPAVCRKCYVHPAVFEAFTDGWLGQVLRAKAEEKAVIAIIQRAARGADHRVTRSAA